MSETNGRTDRTGLEVAVVGLSGRFPGANDVERFWSSILRKQETISVFTKQELLEEGIPEELLSSAGYVRAAGIIENKEYFDPHFFGYSPNEARLMDPQLRIFLECVWEALENAGCNPFSFPDNIGLYAGSSPNFGWELLVRESGLRNVVGDYSASLFSDKDLLTQHVSYRLNLRGPSVNLQTACSTSLVAVHMAIQGLLGGDCQVALAGGVSASCLRKSGYLFQDGMIMSPDGHCRSFDERAAGTVFGEGAGVVVLKLLGDALAAGDHIHAIVRSSAVNNDGREKVGFSATSVSAQVDLIETAHRAAGIEPDAISFIEAHGSGTPLGDPIEVEALGRAFGSGEKRVCAIGSVKTNVGHLNRAAGITGFIKTVMALKDRVIPPQLHFTRENPEIDFARTSFYVSTEPTEFPTGDGPVLAGVSSFGIGGTNAHVVLEEPPSVAADPVPESPQLVVLSAKSAAAIDEMTGRLADFLESTDRQPSLADVAFTLQQGRATFDYRRVLVASSTGEMTANVRNKKYWDQADVVAKHVVFMFPGQGAQYRNMGRDLYDRFPRFRRLMDECFGIFRARLSWDLKSHLYPDGDLTPSRSGLSEMRILQPALFVFQYSLARFLIEAGVQPSAMIGYSFGDYVAACLAGVFSLEDAIELAGFRGELMESLPEGKMLSVPLSEKLIVPLLSPELSLAAVNGPSCIVSGAPAAIRDFEQAMKNRGLMCMPLKTRYAGHAQMPPHLKASLREKIRSLRLFPVETPHVSSLSGEWIEAGSTVGDDYWVEHMVNPIRFYQGVERLALQPQSLFLEVGAGRDLTLLVGRLLQSASNKSCMNLVPPGEAADAAEAFTMKQLGRLWLKGQTLRWDRVFDQGGRRKVPLPSYPFQRQAYWPEDDVYSIYRRLKGEGKQGERLSPEEWGYVGTWKRAGRVEDRGHAPLVPALTVLFMDEGMLGARIAQDLERHGGRVVRVSKGGAFSAVSPNKYILDPERAEDYFEVFNSFLTSGDEALTVLHLWSFTRTGRRDRNWDHFVGEQYNGYFSLQFIARALGKCGGKNPVELIVVAKELQNILGEETTCLEKAPVLGAVNVISKEYPNVRCRSVDLSGCKPGGDTARYARLVAAELSATNSEKEIAYRGDWRWVRTYNRALMPSADGAIERLKPSAAYLVTGGLGGMGLVLAKSLAERCPVRLILTGRSPFPPRNEWSLWLETHGPDNPVSRKIIQLQEIENLGSQVWAVEADCSDYAAMKALLDAHADELGEIRGVIHAAGVTDGALVQRRSIAGCLAIMKPKIQGLYVLERLLRLDALDFFVVCSSISSVIPSVGQIAYCASNIFLDRWAYERALFANARCWSIGWDIWSESGMGRRSYQELKAAGAVPALVKAKELALRHGIRDREGVDAFNRIMAQSEPHVIVSTQDLKDGLEGRAQGVTDFTQFAPQGFLPQAKPAARPERQTAYRAPETETQRALCDIWAAYFGFDDIGADDDFFELGGDSLKANVVLRRVHEELDVTISLADFYENSRVEKLAALIDRTHKTGQVAIPRIAPADFYEVSHAQLRLWLLHEHGDTGHAYNRSSILKLIGPFDLTLFRDCFRSLIERHESLRTAFVSRDGVPLQTIHPHVEFSLVVDDLTASADPEAEVRTQVREELAHEFDLAAPPLFRVRVLRVAPDELISIFTIHHIVCDESSIHILHRELSLLYNSSLGAHGDLPALPVHYKDYVAWNNRLAVSASAESEAHKTFWQRYLSGELPHTALPLDKKRPSEKTYGGKVISGVFPNEISARLVRLAQDGKLSLFMALVALIEVLLHRYTGDEDLVLGTAVSGRDHAQLENQVGFFVNTLPLRYQIRADLTFREILASTKKATLAVSEYQNYPFDKIVEDKKPGRDQARNPLFEIMILLHPDSGAASEFHGVHAEPLTFPSHTSLFDLTFNFRQSGSEILFGIEYNPDLYVEEKIEQICRQLERSAGWLSEHPDEPLKSVSLAQPGEERRLILRRDKEVPAFPPDVTIARLFELRVEKHPDNVALVSKAGVLTYRELNERVNQVAHYLAAHFQLVPDCRIGVCLDRSEDLVIAILAVLKTGCAYVPIDPGYPENRIQYILQDCGAVALLIDEGNERLCNLSPAFPVVPTRQATSPVRTNPPERGASRHLAYVAYTSGSTGRPKGVMIEHQNVVNYFHNCSEVFGVLPQDTVYGLTAVTFDISVMELVCSLLIGSRLVVEHDVFDMDAVAARIRAEGVSVLQMTPSRLHSYLERNSILSLSGVRVMLVGGEVLPSVLHAELRQLENTRVFHVYGPTETTIWSSADMIRGENISLGMPLLGEKIFVVSKDGALMPRGFTGEICIAGDGVGRGYLNQPALTEKQFGSFPFLAGERAYRTGDVGQITLRGELKYLGRSDSQVKIQGVRIETAEIENQLLLHPGVKDAVILARNKDDGRKALWAYVVSEAKETELRRYLAERLPYYMVPEVFVFLDAMPLTVNGKTDRQALLNQAAQPRKGRSSVGASNPVEGKLVEIWRAVLVNPGGIGVQDNFFTLGGNSLKAAQLIARIQAEFQVALALRDVFAGPTIEELASLVEAAQWANSNNREPLTGATDEFII